MDQFRSRRGHAPRLNNGIAAFPRICNLKQNQRAPGSSAASQRSSIDGTLFTAKVCVKLGAESERPCRPHNAIR
jgi:hypothetical protein